MYSVNLRTNPMVRAFGGACGVGDFRAGCLCRLSRPIAIKPTAITNAAPSRLGPKVDTISDVGSVLLITRSPAKISVALTHQQAANMQAVPSTQTPTMLEDAGMGSHILRVRVDCLCLSRFMSSIRRYSGSTTRSAIKEDLSTRTAISRNAD